MFKKVLPLTYLEEERRRNSILCLENNFFYIFRVKIQNVINEEDRLERIKDNLEIIFPKYEEESFELRYELSKEHKKEEELIVYLLDIEYLNNFITDDMKKFISIIPSFFLCREKGLKNYFNFDLSENTLVLSEYVDGRVAEISTFKVSNSSYEDDYVENLININLMNMNKNTEIIFTGREINFENLDLGDKNYSYFKVENLDFRKYLNFLPQALQNKFNIYYMNEKYLFSILLSSLIMLLSTIILFYNISSSEEELENLNMKQAKLEEKISATRSEIEELEKEKIEMNEEAKVESNNSFKVNLFLEELSRCCPREVDIISVEYEGDIFNIEGSTKNMKYIVEFLRELSYSSQLKLSNYDYIMRNNSKIDFKLELKYIEKEEEE